jgi:hypothetical protein
MSSGCASLSTRLDPCPCWICPAWYLELATSNEDANDSTWGTKVHKMNVNGTLQMQIDSNGDYVMLINGETKKPIKFENADLLFDFVRDTSGNPVRYSPREFIMDASTGDVYNAGCDNSQVAVAFKCAMLGLLGIPIFTSANIVWNVIKIALDIGRIAVETIQKIGGALAECKFCDAGRILIKGVLWTLPKYLLKDISAIISAPLYALGLELAAIYGLFSPFEGRKLFTAIEDHWCSGKTMDIVDMEDSSKVPLKDMLHKTAFHFAQCFRRQGNVYKNDSPFVDTDGRSFLKTKTSSYATYEIDI